MEGKGTLESGGKAHSVCLHRRAMPYARGHAEPPKALTSGGCQQDAPGNPKGWRLFPQKLKRKGEPGEKPRLKSVPHGDPDQPEPNDVPFCCIHAHHPLLGLQCIRQDNPGDLLQAQRRPHPRGLHTVPPNNLDLPSQVGKLRHPQ